MEFIKEKSKFIYICLIIIILVIVITFFVNNNNQEEFVFEDTNETIEIKEEKIDLIKVYITGEVASPGVIELEAGSRIEDVIEKAGGITTEANLKDVNLAYTVEDGQKIYIPNKNDIEVEVVSTENGENIILNYDSSSLKININTASVQELCKISGVGEALAQRIVNYRLQNGKFESVEDLKNVTGIGDKKYDSIKDYVKIK